ncbi:MAG: N-acetyl-D-Glu racemase DgcA [Gammaproteobacteria bacterium]
MQLSLRQESWPISGSFAIARGRKTEADVVVVEVRDGAFTGRGECVPYAHYSESVDGVTSLLDGMSGHVTNGLGRARLQELLEAGAARNALDSALWDLEAKRSGKRVWELAGLQPPKPVTTAFTLSLEDPDVMRNAARTHAHVPLLKIKLGGADDLDRVAAVREAAPKARLIVDANEGWTPQSYSELMPELARLGVTMVEQPLPAEADEALAELPRPIPVCADESCHDRSSLAAIDGRYDMINIKLDKTGGLTEALQLRDQARKAGLGIMVGCMISTSLAMAPAVVLAQNVAVVDLDGPLLLARDREDGLHFEGSSIYPPTAALWG